MFEIYDRLADFIVFEVLKLEAGTKLTETLHFFFYDTLKIFTLLTLVIFSISFLRSYFPIEKTRNILSKHKAISLPLAAFLGVLTPFCSCSAIPMFIGFIEAGIPLGAAFAFLVASPMVNEIAIGLLFSTFGLKVTLVYIVFGVAVAIIAGLVIEKINPRDLIADYIFEIKMGETQEREQTFRDRVNFALNNVKDILKKIWIYIVVAIGIGGFIHGYVPADLIENISKAAGILGVPIVTILGIPLYSNAAGTLPIIQPLIEKGVPIGTALAFMMSITALSFPEFLILKQIMKIKLIVIFALIVGISIIVAGYIFNIIL
ncbi:MAG: permease [Hydrogenothermaceae bacterium]